MDVVDIREDEGLIRVEAEGQNVLHVGLTHSVGAFGTIELNFGLVDVLLIVSHLNYKGYIEDALKPLSEDEGDTVTHVEGICRGTSARVKVEWLLVLVGGQDLLQVALAKEDAATDEAMSFLPDGALQTIDQFRSDCEASILLDELVVVDTCVVLGFNRPGSDCVCLTVVLLLSISCGLSLDFFCHSGWFCRVLGSNV